MKATVVDLRYRMNDVLKALERNEKVTILYHGKVKGVLMPAGREPGGKISEHPFFGMSAADSGRSVLEELAELRKGRHDDL